MAFDNVTLFEVNLPNEVFPGTSSGKSEQKGRDTDSTDQHSSGSESGGRSKGRLLVMALTLAGVALAVRRFRSGGDDDEIEMQYEEPGVKAEV